MKHTSKSVAGILTRPPEVVCVLKLAMPTSEIYAVFDPHPRPKHPLGSGLIFNGSLDKAAAYLESLFKVDKKLLEARDLRWQAELLSNFSAQMYIANDVSSKTGGDEIEEMLLGVSLEMLEMKLEVVECKRRISDLEGENKRLERRYGEARSRVWELEAGLVDRMKGWTSRDREDRHGKSKKSSNSDRDNKSTTRYHFSGESTVEEALALTEPFRRTVSNIMNAISPAASTSRQHSGPSSSSNRPSTLQRASTSNSTKSNDVKTPKGDSFPGKNLGTDIDDINLLAATRLQRQFDEEHIQLLSQFQDLKKVDVPIFECGICMESFRLDSVVKVKRCGHQFCGSCLRGYVHSNLESTSAVILPFRCPVCHAERCKEGGGKFSFNLFGLYLNLA